MNKQQIEIIKQEVDALADYVSRSAWNVKVVEAMLNELLIAIRNFPAACREVIKEELK